MSMLLLAAMMMGQAPAAAQPAPVQQQAAKAKPQQICEYIEVTGSRSKRRVCHDVNGSVDLNAYGVSNSLFGKGKVVPQNGGPVGTADNGGGSI
jgi:hypothetical protein